MTFATLAVTFLLVISDAVGQAGTPQREVEALLAWRENLAGFKLDGDLASWNASSDPCEDWQAVLCADDGIISMYLSLPPAHPHITFLVYLSYYAGGPARQTIC